MTLFRVISVFFVVSSSLVSETKFLRFPDIHDDQIVFVHAGDLWTVTDQGGQASRITTHSGLELFPKYSPDGTLIAFSGQYSGDQQVYVIPATGGTPQQLTWYPSTGLGATSVQVQGWTPDGENIVFRSNRDFWSSRDGRLYAVPVSGGLPEPFEIPLSGAGDVSPDGRMLAFASTHIEAQNWRQYRGGTAPDVYVLDRQTGDATRITVDDSVDHAPMWTSVGIVFVSHRSGAANLHLFSPLTGEITQLTHEVEHDIRWPSSDSGSKVVYELNGRLHLYDLNTNKVHALVVYSPTDAVAKWSTLIPFSRNIREYGLDPQGRHAVFNVRGDIFTMLMPDGPARNLTRSSNSHDRLPTWSPDGRSIAFVSDRTGEEQIYTVGPDGHTDPKQVTHNLNTRLYALR